MTKQEKFFQTYSGAAMNSQNITGVPASIKLAQAALESRWGESGLTVYANNFFGIKDFANDYWTSGYYEVPTKEFKNGSYITIMAKFRKYKDATESFIDHSKFLRTYSRYKNLFTLPVTDYKGWANGLQSAGYATDPQYAYKLITMIQQYELWKYDIEAPKKKIVNYFISVLIFTSIALGIAFYKKKLQTTKEKATVISIGVLSGLAFYYAIFSYQKYKFNH